jgi:hypothetical protein
MGSIVLLAGLAACAAEESPEPAADLNGPALIMFYTDN